MKKQILTLAIALLFYSNSHTAAYKAGPSVVKKVAKHNKHKQSDNKKKKSKVTLSNPAQVSQPAAKADVSASKQISHQLLIANPLEIGQLLNKYSNPITVQLDSGQEKVQLTKKALDHIFGMEVKEGDDDLKSPSLKGFHHDYHFELEDQHRSFYSCSKSNSVISEGFIAHKKTHLPVFKTMFSCLLPREQVIKALAESLQNIQSIEDQADQSNFLLKGKVAILNGKNEKVDVIINTAVNKKTKKIVTFFPSPESSQDEIKEKKERLQILWKKHFLNIEKRPERQSMTEEEAEQLLQRFSHGIQVDWNIIGDNLLFANNKQVSQEAADKLNPRIDDMMPRYIKNVNITAQSLANVFSLDNDKNFPIYLGREEILTKLKEALQNITIYGRGDAQDFTLIRDDIEYKMTDYDNGEPHRDSFIEKDAESSANLLRLECSSNGKDQKDAWTFLVDINEDTGDLKTFWPLFR